MKDKLIKFIISGFYTGYFPFASGTVGTLAAVAVFFICGSNFIFRVIILLLFTILGFIFAGNGQRLWNEKDSSKIVIDEISGYLLTVLLIQSPLYGGNWSYMIIAFILFRIFDVLKPFPIRKSESIPGSAGIMVDDLIAGFYSMIILEIIKLSCGSLLIDCLLI